MATQLKALDEYIVTGESIAEKFLWAFFIFSLEPKTWDSARKVYPFLRPNLTSRKPLFGEILERYCILLSCNMFGG